MKYSSAAWMAKNNGNIRTNRQRKQTNNPSVTSNDSETGENLHAHTFADNWGVSCYS